MEEHQNPGILGLPNNILTAILELVGRREMYNRINPILLVCRRFYELSKPFQYERVYLHYSVCSSGLRSYTEKLYRTLQENPGVGQYCRDLTLSIQDDDDIDSGYQPEHFPLFQHIITSTLPNVHSLKLSGGFSSPQKSPDWNLLRSCVASMPSLRTVSLQHSPLSERRGTRGGLDVRTVMDALRGTSIRRLVMFGFNRYNWPIWQQTSQVFGTSCITELDLYAYSEWPENTASLLNWLETLTSLKFGCRHYDERQYMDLPMLASMLTKHKDTLVKLSIGSLSEPGRGRPFDISAFTGLEELEVAGEQLIPPLPGQFREEEYSFLLAPNLRVLKLVFGGCSKANDDFNERARRWLQGFAKAAVRQKVPLQEIVIDLPGSPDNHDPDFWPFWYAIDALKRDLRSKGIKLILRDRYNSSQSEV